MLNMISGLHLYFWYGFRKIMLIFEKTVVGKLRQFLRNQFFFFFIEKNFEVHQWYISKLYWQFFTKVSHNINISWVVICMYIVKFLQFILNAERRIRYLMAESMAIYNPELHILPMYHQSSWKGGHFLIKFIQHENTHH